MANRIEVFFDIDKDGQGRARLRMINSDINRMGQTAQGAGSAIESSLSFLKGALLVEFFRRGASAALEFGAAAVKAFNDAQAAAKGLESVAIFKGVGPDAAKDAIQNLDLVKSGLLSVVDATLTLKNLLQSGFSLPDAIRLMEVFGDSAAFNRQASLGFGEAIVRTSEGIRLGLSTLSDGVGVTQNLGQMLEAAGISASRLSNITQDAAVRQAIYNGFQREAAATAGDAAKFAETYAGQIARVEAEQRKLLVALGEQITQSPELQAGLKSVSEILAEITKEIQTSGTNLNTFIKDVRDSFGGLIDVVKIGLPVLKAMVALFNLANENNPFAVHSRIQAANRTPEEVAAAKAAKEQQEAEKKAAEEQKAAAGELARQNAAAAAESQKALDAITNEVKAQNDLLQVQQEAYKRIDEEEKKAAEAAQKRLDMLAGAQSRIDDLRARLSDNPLTQIFRDADSAQAEFFKNFKDATGVMKEEFSVLNEEVRNLESSKALFSQSAGLGRLIRDKALLESGLAGRTNLSPQEEARIRSIERESIDRGLADINRISRLAETDQQRALANQAILDLTSNVGALSFEQRDARLKALSSEIPLRQRALEENIKMLERQTGAVEENSFALIQVGNRLAAVEGALTNFAKKPIGIVIEDNTEPGTVAVDLGSVGEAAAQAFLSGGR